MQRCHLISESPLLITPHDGETDAIEGMSHFALFAAFVVLVLLGLV